MTRVALAGASRGRRGGARDRRRRRARASSASTSRAGLSSRSALKAAWRTSPSAVKPANSISATSSGFSQWTVRSPSRRAFAGERALGRGLGLQRRHQRLHLGGAVARADAADIGELPSRKTPASSERNFAGGLGPAADHHLVAAAALGLGPAVRAAGGVGRVQALGDDALQREVAGRLQHGLAACRRNARRSAAAARARRAAAAPRAAPCGRRAAGARGPRPRPTAGRRRRR